ncbi:TolB family protein, partial [Salmonella sp. SAL4436]|uniref:TolB family protein n=1 Tax=Salmonella sp. SAL4436 TaxID=3159891 RepID=UPI0039789739
PDETDIAPFLTADGEELWFASDRADTRGSLDLFRATRTDSGFARLVHERGVSSGERDSAPVLSADRRTIYFFSTRDGGSDVWTARR